MSEIPLDPQSPPLAPDDGTQFRHALYTQTPRVWATPLLVGINVAVFLAMVASGVHPMSPTIDSLLRWGADYAPRTMAGQWWRLLTNTFIHIGVFHVAMNMIGLWQIGFLVERMIGNRGFLVAYLVSGLCGSVTSLAWNPSVVSAGASGAVFGVYGVLIAYLVRNRGSIPRQVWQPLQRSALFFVGLNVFYGFQVKGIDMAAHLGGLLGGVGGGFLVVRPLAIAPRKGPPLRELLLAVVGLAVVATIAARLPPAIDFQAEMASFQVVERTCVDAYNGAVEASRSNQLSDAEVAQVIDRQVLPDWRQYQKRLRSLGHLPAAQQERVTDLLRYMVLRERGWSMFSEALRTNDAAKATSAAELQKQAEALMKAPDAKEGKEGKEGKAEKEGAP